MAYKASAAAQWCSLLCLSWKAHLNVVLLLCVCTLSGVTGLQNCLGTAAVSLLFSMFICYYQSVFYSILCCSQCLCNLILHASLLFSLMAFIIQWLSADSHYSSCSTRDGYSLTFLILVQIPKFCYRYRFCYRFWYFEKYKGVFNQKPFLVWQKTSKFSNVV